MPAEQGLFLFFTLFQLAGVFLLASRAQGERRVPNLLLAALLLANGLLSGIVLFEPQWQTDPTLARWFSAIDSPTGALIIGYVLWRRGFRRPATGVIGVGLATGIATLLWPEALLGPGALYWLLIPLPYHASLAAIVLHCSTSDATERWIGMAFLPRAGFFATQGYLSVAAWGSGPLPLLLSGLYQLSGALLIIPIAIASFRMWRSAGDGGPPASVILAGLLLGPADVFALNSINRTTPLGVVAAQFLNFLTLGLVRPLFIYIALAPEATRGLLSRVVLAAGIGTGVLALAPRVGFSPMGATITGASLASLSLMTMEGLGTARAVPQREGLDENTIAVSRRPQWQTLLLALYRAGAGNGGPPVYAWTQKALAEGTGISVKRISEFPASLNSSAPQRLSQHVQNWTTTAAAPVLVTTHRGAVEGLQGGWVYYRLTPLGLILAKAVWEKESLQRISPTQ